MSASFPIAGVIGFPVAHSLSPLLHGGWLADLGIKGAYVPLEVAPSDLPAAIGGLKALGFAGANVTIPHKESVLQLVDSIDSVAQAIGAVNTLINRGGVIEGRNTDAHGFLANLDGKVPGWRSMLGNRTALVLGAGGAAKAVLYALRAAGISRIAIANRHAARAKLIAHDCQFIEWGDRNRAVPSAGLIVNTTSLGMRGQPVLELDLSRAPQDAVVYDLVYNPLRTELLRGAAARSLRTVDGLGMLIHQARAGFSAWFGVEPPIDEAIYSRLAAALT